MSILDRILGVSSEHSVFQRSNKIIDHAVAANKILVKIVKGYRNLDEIRRIENLADKEVFEISNSITAGAIAPNLLDDMIRFVDKEDDIVDTMFNLARAIIRYKNPDRKVEKYVRENLLELTKLINSALVILNEMHKAQTVAQAQVLRSKIESIEQRGDEIKDAMLDYAYDAKVDFKAFYYIQSAAYLSDDILDGCEDNADMMVSIMRSILS